MRTQLANFHCIAFTKKNKLCLNRCRSKNSYCYVHRKLESDSSNPKNCSTLWQIPDLILMIFRFLSIKELRSIRLTNRYLHNLGDHEIIKRFLNGNVILLSQKWRSLRWKRRHEIATNIIDNCHPQKFQIILQKLHKETRDQMRRLFHNPICYDLFTIIVQKDKCDYLAMVIHLLTPFECDSLITYVNVENTNMLKMIIEGGSNVVNGAIIAQRYSIPPAELLWLIPYLQPYFQHEKETLETLILRKGLKQCLLDRWPACI